MGIAIPLAQAEPGYDVVIFKRGLNPAQGHVGFYAGRDETKISVLGGNQGNEVSIASFSQADVLGVRRLG